MKIKNMTDEQCLNKFLEFITEGRVEIDTTFVAEEGSTVATHQVIKLKCGDYVTYSKPEPLVFPMKPATPEDLGATVN